MARLSAIDTVASVAGILLVLDVVNGRGCCDSFATC
jgi:hypothetical protein